MGLISFLTDVNRPFFLCGYMGMHDIKGILSINIVTFCFFLAPKCRALMRAMDLVSGQTYLESSASRTF